MNPAPNTNAPLLRGTSIVSALTLASRVLGFIREILLARLFGTGVIAEAFIVALRIPNLLRSFVAEGALTSAFVPVFTSALQQGKEQAQTTIRSVSGLLLVITTLLSALGILFSREIVHFYAPGFGTETEKSLLCIQLTQIMFPYIICVSLVAMLNGALNSVKIFGAAAMAQVVMNAVLIAGTVIAGWYSPMTGVIILALSVIVGGLVQVIIQMPSLRRAGFSILPSTSFFTPQTRELMKLMFPAIIGATIYQITIFVSTVLASLLVEGSVAYLSFADRLTQLPIGIFTISLASVLLPTLSTAKAEGDDSAFSKHLINALRYTSFVMIPLSAAMFYFAKPLIILIFERGAFSAISSENTALAVQGYSLGLWAISCHSMVARGFIARKNTITPTLVGLCTLVVSLTLSLLLMGPLAAKNSGAFFTAVSAARDFVMALVPIDLQSINLGHVGLALSSSLSSFFSVILLSYLLSRVVPGLSWRPFTRSTTKAIVASLGMIGVLDLLQLRERGVIIGLVLGAIIGGLLYIVFSWLLKSQELGETVQTITRTRGKR